MRESISYLSIDFEQINDWMDNWFILKLVCGCFVNSFVCLIKKDWLLRVICSQITMVLLLCGVLVA